MEKAGFLAAGPGAVGDERLWGDNLMVRWVICVATSILWLAGCSAGPTPQVTVTTTMVGDGTQTVQPTARVLPTASEQAIVTPTPISTETPSPRPPTPTTAPTVSPHTATPVPPAEEPFYEDRTGPTSLLASYYNAINRREYARAWAYWESPPSPSYEAFVQGFADTASVLLAVRPPTWFEGAAGSTYTRVPALMTGIHLDGSWHNFVACFIARRFNVEGPGVEQGWSLYGATVLPTPGNSADALLLVGACDPAPLSSYDDRSGPVRLLASYYNAIDLGEYARAWAYWETPPAPTFEAFAQGFADTESVVLMVRPPTRLEGAAGSVYTAIPALVSATHGDDSRHTFVGCFVARRSNVGPASVEREWSLFDAAIQRAPGNRTDVMMLNQVCATH